MDSFLSRTAWNRILLLATALASYHCDAGTIKVAYLSPPADRSFWQNTNSILQAAADNLGVQLRVKISRVGSYGVKKDGLELLNAADKPDYFLTIFVPGATEVLLQTAEERGIKTIVFNTQIPDEFDVGKPRGKLKNWLGHLHPDDEYAGRKLLNTLDVKARRLPQVAPGETLELFALNGLPEMSASIFRDAGLQQQLRYTDKLSLLNELNCDWSVQCAYSGSLKLLAQNPHTRIIWAASDSMALGAARAAHEQGKVVGRDVVVGGIDWTPEGIAAVRDGTLTLSMGGHFMEGAWALILLYDYANGIDFINDAGMEILTPMSVIDQTNAEHYMHLLQKADWHKLDFSRFSKFKNRQLSKYSFDPAAALEQLGSPTQ